MIKKDVHVGGCVAHFLNLKAFGSSTTPEWLTIQDYLQIYKILEKTTKNNWRIRTHVFKSLYIGYQYFGFLLRKVPAIQILIMVPHERRHYIFIRCRKVPVEAAILFAGFRSCSSQSHSVTGLVRPT